MDQLQRFRIPIMVVVVGVAGIATFSVLRPPATTQAISVTLRPTAIQTSTPDKPASIQVYVSGAVKQPDVYELPPGSIIKDAMLAAGGSTDETDLERINLAAPLSDGMQIHFPREGESAILPPSNSSTGASASTSGPININTATLEQLDTLSGVGPAIAQRIIDYRETNGAFSSIEQITEVSGIGDKMLENIKDNITVGP